MRNRDNRLFNRIASVYALFYPLQQRSYARIIDQAKQRFDLTQFDSVVDVGCGTGALCSVLKSRGMAVTGVDPAVNMLRAARKKPGNAGITFIEADVLKTLPFADDAFDLAIASYVAHGLPASERRRMYAEMSRIAKQWVIIHDYNANRSWPTTLIEWLEGGDYFHFIKHAEPEMKHCVDEMKACFSQVDVIKVGARASWYMCRPRQRQPHAE